MTDRYWNYVQLHDLSQSKVLGHFTHLSGVSIYGLRWAFTLVCFVGIGSGCSCAGPAKSDSIVAEPAPTPSQFSARAPLDFFETKSFAPVGRPCGGARNAVCPGHLECLDDPRDACDPEMGGLHCMGFCERESFAPSRLPSLASLRVVEQLVAGYDQAAWPRWIDADGDCQNTLQEVLIRDSEVPVTFKTERECEVVSGRWTCPYSAEVLTSPNSLVIDSLVPLEAAYGAGGHLWDEERRRAYANDLGDEQHLLAVKAAVHSGKSGKGPQEWLPPLEKDVCAYLWRWAMTKVHWRLAFTKDEFTFLKLRLDQCGTYRVHERREPAASREDER